MGYTLHAFIGKQTEAEMLVNRYIHAKKIELAQGLWLIPLTEKLFDEINNFEISPLVDDAFMYMNENIEKKVLELMGNRLFAYVEADYFGGIGGQMGIVWSNKVRVLVSTFGSGKINEVLRRLGAVREQGSDEFERVGLDRNRDTRDWVENAD